MLIAIQNRLQCCYKGDETEMYDYEKEHIARLRTGLAECTVLLKSNGDFPLEQPCEIAAYGSGVRHTVKGGTGSGEVNSRYFINIENGLKAAGFTVTTEKWLAAYDQILVDAKKRFVKEVKERARKKHVMAAIEGMGAVMPEPECELPLDGYGDAAIYVLSRISGEGNDREPVGGDIKLTCSEIRDILALNRKYSKFMLVLNVGGVVDLGEVAEVDNILYLSQLGVETGSTLADILLGKSNPSGKLAASWLRWEDYPSIIHFGDKNDTRYLEGIYVGYRYFDSVGKKALFPFGYGLSYTSFQVIPEQVTADGEAITVKVTVTNTGNYSGKEVIQIYVSVPEGKLDQPYQALAAFAKTSELTPGSSQTMQIGFRLSELASYDAERSEYILESGKYIVRVGNCSTNTTVAAVLSLDAEAIVLKARRICIGAKHKDWRPEKRINSVIPDDVKTISVSAKSIASSVAQYDKAYPIDDAVRELSDQELAWLNVGNFDPNASALSIIGNASQAIAGAAGETTSLLKNKGFPILIMADGPAGLRLSPKSFRDEKGDHTIGQGGIPESLQEYLPKPLKLLMKLAGGSAKPKKGQTITYRYATAIPIGTAIANSWNLSFAEVCGDIVGNEMQRFGVHLWLAPALNLQRSIRCGRNFEYYSEDPLISGKFAAAMTLGVQKHPGCGTTIKHFAANNQEYNRYNNNSIVSERALRETYLKGFGICVKEAHPYALMTSFNLINGQHTAECRDIIEDVLRCEFNFQGIVMTDWIIGDGTIDKTSAHPGPKVDLIAAAGGDLVMPGGKKDFDNIIAGLARGTVTRRQLEINATRIYRTAKKLNTSLHGSV